MSSDAKYQFFCAADDMLVLEAQLEPWMGELIDDILVLEAQLEPWMGEILNLLMH
jgi:hypothetical protein